MLRNKILSLIFFIGLFVACKNTSVINEFSFKVISPTENNTYYDDLPIIFSINKSLNYVEWSSSINGKLGSGSQISAKLSPGKHKIQVKTQDYRQIFYITVLERADENCEQTKFRILYSPFNCELNKKTYNAYIASLDGEANNLSIKNNNISRCINKNKDTDSFGNLKFFRCADNIDLKNYINSAYSFKDIKRNIRNQNEKKFFIVNTENQVGDAHHILFKKYYSSSNLDVWIPKDTLIETDAIDYCIAETENLILIRVTEIFGRAEDIDGNNKISIIFSPTINDEKKALGFFNPADFFKNNTDKNAANYNPASNEADIIYAAVPSTNSNSNYYYKAIAATIGHELTHAVSFSAKTYSRIKNGNIAAPRMEIFLDEGISHLSENLIGFGVSGGNIKFFNKFLEDTSAYSFCKNNAMGLGDSAGQRGAMTLFLSWCFWEKGGISWNPENKVHIIDKGGVSFLRKLINSEYTDWEAIGDAFGTPTDKLFLQMLDSITKKINLPKPCSYKIDPFTNEAVEFLPCMGLIQYQDTEIHIGEPSPQINENSLIKNLLPYSFIFVDKKLFKKENETTMSIYAEKIKGNILLCLFI